MLIGTVHAVSSSVVNCESESSELLGKSVSTLQDAFDLYNEYAFKFGFGVRKSRNRMKADKTGLRGKEFCCCKAGFKKDTGLSKLYRKIDTRTGCRAMVFFEFDDKDGLWRVKEHNMEHNHSFVPLNQRHLIKSHKKLKDKDLECLTLLKSMGYNVDDGAKLFTKENGGSPALSCVVDAGSKPKFGKTKYLKGTDANILLGIFMTRLKNEKEFYYSVEFDDESGALVSVFWRDRRMRRDYELFGDVVMFDTTYQIYNHDLVCCPFFGINNHAQKVMFGCGFILNERIESFQWLFSKFLNSMDNLVPKTILTIESAPMAVAIKEVFQGVHHSLCTWHIEENSKEDIKSLRGKPGFVSSFENCIRHCDSIDEFEHYWQRLLSDYDCSSNSWLQNLYIIRSKWCPAYSSHIFSGGILGAQRIESANNSIQRKLLGVVNTADIYHKFCDIVIEWRNNEKTHNCRCPHDMQESLFRNVNLINNALQVYTNDVFRLFEDEFKKILSCQQVVLSVVDDNVTYKVWTSGCEGFSHTVVFNTLSHEIRCTCNKFNSCGILCRHCLRIYNIQNVQSIPDQYILKRWTKHVSSELSDGSNDGSTDCFTAGESSWACEMKHKFGILIDLCDSSERTRMYMDEVYNRAKDYVESYLSSREICSVKASSVKVHSSLKGHNTLDTPAKCETNKRKVSAQENSTDFTAERSKRSAINPSKTEEGIASEFVTVHSSGQDSRALVPFVPQEVDMV